MKNKLKLTSILLLLIILISTFSYATETTEAIEESTTGAENIVVTEQTTDATEQSANALSTDDWVNGDVYKIEDKVELNNIVDGNVFVMANEVVINTEIGGDVFVMARKVTVTENAYIYSGLFAMAQEVNINGIVCDAYIASGDLTIAETGYIYRDLKATANTIKLDGKIRRNANVTFVNCNIASDKGYLVGGDFNYASNNEITVPEGVVQGSVNFNKQEVKEQSAGATVSSYIFSAINNITFTLIIVLLAVWLAPKFVEKVSNMSVKKSFASLGIGVLTPIVGFIAAFLLLISSVCSSVGIALMFFLITLCITGTAFACLYFGSLFAKLFKWEGKIKLALCSAISALAIWLISLIPCVGLIISLLVSSFGIGTLITNVFTSRKSEE